MIPFVEDRRNALLLDLEAPSDAPVLASLESALKSAIQAVYQLEDNELATYPLPTPQDRRASCSTSRPRAGPASCAGSSTTRGPSPRSPGRRSRSATSTRPRERIGTDRRGRVEDCEAACYDCLMHYGNQLDHEVLDRKAIAPLLLKLATGRTELSPGARPRATLLAELKRLCSSDLERRWLDFLEERGLRLPSDAQPMIEAATPGPTSSTRRSRP